MVGRDSRAPRAPDHGTIRTSRNASLPPPPLRSRSASPPSSSWPPSPSCRSGTARASRRSPSSSDGSTRPCCTCRSRCCSSRSCWSSIRLPRLERVRSQLPQHRSRFRALAGGAQRLCGRPRGMAPVPRGRLRRAAPGPAPLERGRHRHRRVRLCTGAVLCQGAAGPGRPGTPGHRPGGGHRWNDDLRRPRRRKPDPRRGLPHGACAGADPSPGGSSHPPRPLPGDALRPSPNERSSMAWPCASSKATAPPATTRASSRAS